MLRAVIRDGDPIESGIGKTYYSWLRPIENRSKLRDSIYDKIPLMTADNPTRYLRQNVLWSNIIANRKAINASNIQKVHGVKKGNSYALLERQIGTVLNKLFEENRFRHIMSGSDVVGNVGTGTFDEAEALRQRLAWEEGAAERARADAVWGPQPTAEQQAEADRRQQRFAAFEDFMADDFTRSKKSFTEMFDGDEELADKALRKELKSKLPRFFKNSEASTKDLHRLSRVMGGIKGFAGTNNPYALGAAIAGSVLAAAGKVGKIQYEADKKVVKWGNARNLFGTMPTSFMDAALLAGIKDPDKMYAMHGSLVSTFGSASNAAKVAKSIKDMPPIARMAVAKDFGWSADDLAVLDILARTGRIGVTQDRARVATTHQKQIGTTLKESESKFFAATKGLLDSVTDTNIFSTYWSDDKTEEWQKKFGVTQDRANSPSSPDAGSSSGSVSNTSNKVSWNIGTINLEADNPEEMIEQLQRKVGSGNHTDILAGIDSREVA